MLDYLTSCAPPLAALSVPSVMGIVIVVLVLVIVYLLMSKKKKADAEAPVMVPVVPQDPTPAEKLAQTSFETSQTDGLPQFGQNQDAAPVEPAEAAAPAQDAPATPLWAQPSGDLPESFEDLDDMGNN